MTSQSFKEFFAIFTSLLWESFEFHKILYLSSRGTSMGKFKRVNICYRATVFHIPKKNLEICGDKNIALILTDKHYFLLTHFVEIINTITRIFQWSFRCAGMHKYILLKWKYTFNYCIKDFIASVQHRLYVKEHKNLECVLLSFLSDFFYSCHLNHFLLIFILTILIFDSYTNVFHWAIWVL